jgi:hypothetical protein
MALVTVRGTEFGEIDNPARGGYTEPGWNKGAFGASLAGIGNEGFALPPSVLKPYGYGQKGFATNFNNNYEIRVVNPATGQSVTGPLKDIGPGPGTGAGIDMLWASREKLGYQPNFSGQVQYEIVPKGSGGSGSPTSLTAQHATSSALASSTSPVTTGTIPVAGRAPVTTPAPAAGSPWQKLASYLGSSETGGGQAGGTDSAEAEDRRRLQAAMYLTPSLIASNPVAVYQAMLSARGGGGGGGGFAAGASAGSDLLSALFKSKLLAPRATAV